MKKLLLTLSITLFSMMVFSQNVGIGTNTPQAALDVTSSTNGFLPPRMTYAQRNAIVNPAAGLIIYCTDCDSSGQPQFYNGIRWCNMMGAVASSFIAVNLPSVTIGSQVWTTRNLDVARYRNGEPIPKITDSVQWVNLTTGAWCWYNNDSATYASTYGKLYNWYAVNDPRGLAPQGWHLPTDAEWNKLTKFIDTSADTTQCCSNIAGTAMKNQIGWNNGSNGTGNGTNTSGFAGLPGGYRGFRGSNVIFLGIGYDGYWWSSSEFDSTFAWDRFLFYNNSSISKRNYFSKFYGFSVRLVRD